MSSPTLKLSIFAPQGTAVFCRAEDEHGRSFTHVTTIPFGDPNDWYEKFLAAWRDNDRFEKLTDQDCADFGKQLFDAIFQAGGRAALQQVRDTANIDGKSGRLAICLEDARLFETPFELLHDGDDHIRSSGTRIVRVLNTIQQQQAGFRPLKRLLVLMAEPSDQQSWGRAQHAANLIASLKTAVAEVVSVQPPTFANLAKIMREAAQKRLFFDAAYIVAHGVAAPNKEPTLILEKHDAKGQEVQASALAELFRDHPGAFVWLGACQSSLTTSSSAHSGVAQRLVAGGRAGAVLAMQRPVMIEDALKAGEVFFEAVAGGAFPEKAIEYARPHLGSAHRWAVLTFYSQVRGAEQEEAARIAHLLGIDETHKTLDVFLPNFKMGMLKSEFEKLKPEEKPATTHYHYPGSTIARSDFEAAWVFVRLYERAFAALREPGEIRFKESSELNASDASHGLLIGTRSQELLGAVLEGVSSEFNFSFSDSDKKWMLKDTKLDTLYQLPAPQHEKSKEDFLLIQKARRPGAAKTIFVLAGFTAYGTKFAAEYLVDHWEELQRKFGDAAFAKLIRYNLEGGEFLSAEIEREIMQPTTSG